MQCPRPATWISPVPRHNAARGDAQHPAPSGATGVDPRRGRGLPARARDAIRVHPSRPFRSPLRGSVRAVANRGFEGHAGQQRNQRHDPPIARSGNSGRSINHSAREHCAPQFARTAPRTSGAGDHRQARDAASLVLAGSRVGRPAIPAEVPDLVRTTSPNNLLRGAPSIHGELLMLGIDIAQSMVAKYLPRASLSCCRLE